MAQTPSDDDIGSNQHNDWFVKLLLHFLRTYVTKVNAKYFREKYPNVPPDAIVDRRIESAKKAAATSGAVTGLVYSGALVTTVSTLGGSSAIILGSIAADTAYIVNIQMQLAYDISVIYGYPPDIEDPEDLTLFLDIAFGMKAGELFSRTVRGLAPEGTRVFVKNVASGATLRWLKALPVVGRYLLQRNIIKTAIPVVGIGLGAGMNYYLTGTNGRRAKKIYRKRPLIFDHVNGFPLHNINDKGLLMGFIWLTIYSDNYASPEETWFLQEFLNRLKMNGYEVDYDDFAKRVYFDKEQLLACLSMCSNEEKEVLLKAAYLAAAVDGDISKEEIKFIQEIAHHLGVPFDEQALRELAKQFK